jgi:FlaA1/EpsC-like NDP-sugar epimerase
MNKSIVMLRNRYLFLADLVFIALSILISLALRDVLAFYLPAALWMIGAAMIVKPIVYWRFGLYRRFWAYASIK